ncbi:cytochrome bd-I ubiquinol oxidase subunit 1 apoprotein [Methylophilus rhizosphaerae]|uniref:Cytochrome bd-I ubiquinol oxidase subunit 1 apoprotein n=1 Tax=Methylophilus rhizosphaerae TaxID=492660 RepID=A0A1G9B650_9PROT|nr:cytochrome ubiquinol oxidase subunit I [Methylophilus rhizosphaerae]SDK35011.1 cytochrome bd-I ubiquinol oxidase subunit 1 apoprotein [Methylophilus rhizosphaerae]
MSDLALTLARFQFGFTISFHIIFPAITIGLASYLAVLEASWLKSRNTVYLDLYHFWVKIFSLCFGMGVVSGLVMAYQFGTNWAGFSSVAGSVTGPLLAYEVLTAFFLEAGFLGVMLFGWNKVGPELHFTSTVMVALGTLVSATWILASNSWMQTPQGFELVDGKVIPLDWFKIIFNPSFPYRLIHMVIAAYLATALFVVAAGGWQLLHGKNNPAVRKMLSMGLWLILLLAPLQVVIGDMHGLNTLKHQPAKIAAIEAHWENKGEEATPLVLLAWPDMAQEKNLFAVEIPVLGSLILRHSLTEQIPALKDFPARDRPNATIIFWSFRVMVGLGMLMILLAVTSAWLRWKGTLYQNSTFQKFCILMGPAGLIAILAGWFTTEIGRQPWVVYGLLRTVDAVTPHTAGEVGLTLALFVVIYFALFGMGTVYVLRLVNGGPKTGEALQGDAISINRTELDEFMVAPEFHPDPQPSPPTTSTSTGKNAPKDH